MTDHERMLAVGFKYNNRDNSFLGCPAYTKIFHEPPNFIEMQVYATCGAARVVEGGTCWYGILRILGVRKAFFPTDPSSKVRFDVVQSLIKRATSLLSESLEQVFVLKEVVDNVDGPVD